MPRLHARLCVCVQIQAAELPSGFDDRTLRLAIRKEWEDMPEEKRQQFLSGGEAHQMVAAQVESGAATPVVPALPLPR
jgi:hypothetical protein